MLKRRASIIVTVLASFFLIQACKDLSRPGSYRPRVTATTEMIAEAASSVGNDFVTVSMMTRGGSGPHSYGANEHDVIRLADSDIIFYNGLYLEGRLQDVLKKIDGSIPAVMVSSGMEKGDLIQDDSLRGGFNPHFWTDVRLWIKAVSHITDTLVKISPSNERIYRQNEELYIMKLHDLDRYIRERAEKIPEEKRVLITVHDSFNYFGRAYGFRTAALQGADADYEISQADVSRLSDYIIKNNVKVVFTEASVPPRNMLTLQAALRASGYDVKIGGILYADVLISRSGEAPGYIETMTHNIDTIIKALAGAADAKGK